LYNKFYDKRLVKNALPEAGNNKILFGNKKVFIKIETHNKIEYILEQQVIFFNKFQKFFIC